MTKYIGPKTDGENVATQADKLSLSSETPDALIPDQTGAAGTATTAARSDHQHEILAAAAGTITGTNAEGTSTSFARADHNHAYGALSIPNSALALGPTYETSLPGSPVDGQEIYYAADATNGIIWHLRYRSGGGTYKWEFVGGSSLTAEDNDSRTVTSGTYADVPTDQVVLTIPVAGEYLVTQIATVQIAANGQFGYVSLAITNASNTVQTEASDDWGILAGSPGASGSSGNVSFTGSTTDTFTISTAGWKLRERARAVNTLSVLRRRIIAQPIRVG